MRNFWKGFPLFAAAVTLGLLLIAAAPQPASAQVNINVNIGPEPVCPYGYFNYAPYNCAPFGYYGPQWFQTGIFIGAGPWFHDGRYATLKDLLKSSDGKMGKTKHLSEADLDALEAYLRSI